MVVGISMSAQSLSSLWKAYEKAQDDDQPKTATRILHDIQSVAEKKKAYGDLLLSLFREMETASDISEDSCKVTRQRLFKKMDEWKMQGKGVMTTLAQTVLSMSFRQSWRYGSSQRFVDMPKIDSLLAAPDAAEYTKKNSANAYYGFIIKGVDSKYFNNDLLHVIGLSTQQYQALQKYYATTSNRKAACITAALCMEHHDYPTMLKTDNAKAQKYANIYSKNGLLYADSLIEKYQDLQECGEIAYLKYTFMPTDSARMRYEWLNEIKQRWPKWQGMNKVENALNDVTGPTLSRTSTISEVITDQKEVKFETKTRNISKLKVTLTHNDGAPVIRYFDMPKKEVYEFSTDTISLGRLALGKWTINMTSAEGNTNDVSRVIKVSNLKVMTIALPQEMRRYVVVNSITGKPVAGAKLDISSRSDGKDVATYTTDENGEVLVKAKDKDYYRAYTDEDNVMPNGYSWFSYGYRAPEKYTEVVKIYTDRAIYKPGQTVHANVVAWQLADEKDVKVSAGEYVMVKLCNAQGKKMAEKEVKTDDFGAAAVDFELPENERNGVWSLRTSGQTQTFRVEEYKRPTFEVTLEKPQEAYHCGDTLLIKGMAKMYSGAPVPDATVTYIVNRHTPWWWRDNDSSSNVLQKDTVKTAADGSFTVRMPMISGRKDSPKDGNGVNCGKWLPPYFLDITASATVTSISGESHSAELDMPLSNRDTYLSTNIPARILADTAVVVKFKRLNMSGDAIDGKVELTLDGNTIAAAEANKPYTLPATIPSGEHKLVAICGADTLKTAFTVFRKTDTVPMTYTHNWFYQSAERFSEKTNDAWIQLGTSDEDVYAVYTILSGDSVLESGHFNMSNEVRARTFIYNKGYGDGIMYLVSWIKNEKWYFDNATIKRPEPSKSLNLKWTTFRDKLTPGQKEKWTMQITNPDGTPANAQLMAVLYDKSLDQLAKNRWTMPDKRNSVVPFSKWFVASDYSVYFYLNGNYKMKEEKTLVFSRITGTYLPYEIQKKYNDFAIYDCVESAPLTSASVKGLSRAKAVNAVGMMTVEPMEDVEEEKAAEEPQQNDGMRSDFAETAFFMPALMTDKNGNATLQFTLPQSVTTWHFKGLAHDKEMRNGLLESDAVAQKQLMVQPNMPRFLRQGDKATIAATVTNMSEKALSANVTMTIIDQETEKTVMTASQKVSVKPGNAAAVTYPVDAAKLQDKAYICRVMAESGSHKDGEQHLLPVLSDKEQVTATATYTVYEPKDTTIDIANMIPATATDVTKKVVHVANPAALMTDALNDVKVPESNNAISLATAIYAGGNCYGDLQKLQASDGAISWFPGMNGSVYMTTAVVKILARHDVIAGHHTAAEPILNRAFRYLQKEMDKRVKDMKEMKKKGFEPWLSYTELDWLYALTISGRNGGESAAYLRRLIVEDTKHSDMETKAVAAIVLNANKKKKDAKTFVEAIKQHTVMRSDVGRYFDSRRAAYSWFDYRIPTQVMAIEALQAVTPDDSRTITEMRRWLLSSKRTQQWDTPYNTVNAVHAFIGNMSELPKNGKGIVTLETKQNSAADSTGTVKINGTKVLVKAAPKNVNGVQETWTSMFVSYKQKSAEVQNQSTGIKVSRQVFLQRKGSDNASAAALDGNVGDKVITIITVEADRDYDFVTVSDNRAACLEPVQAVSGYRYGCYQEIKDKCTNFYFDKLNKGSHTIRTDYYIDRSGNYNAGTATAVCTYAPEFRGTCSNYIVNSNEK